MSFAQQRQRKPPNKHQDSFTSDDFSSVKSSDSSINNVLLLPTQAPSSVQSDSDWDVINSSIPSTSSSVRTTGSTSIILSGSESYSSFRYSDSESNSDADGGALNSHELDFSTLPFHDGTFIQDSNNNNNNAGTAFRTDPNLFTQTIQQLLSEQTSQEEDDDEEELHANESLQKRRLDKWDHSEEELPNIFLPHGGLRPPSFISKTLNIVDDTPPSFVPTTAGFTLQNGSSSNESNEVILKADHKLVINQKKRSFDSISTYPPGIPDSSPSTAIISIVWNNLRRFTQHILENDSNTAEIWGDLIMESVMEGCLPFGSHIHMEIGSGVRTSHQSTILGSTF